MINHQQLDQLTLESYPVLIEFFFPKVSNPSNDGGDDLQIKSGALDIGTMKLGAGNDLSVGSDCLMKEINDGDL